MARLVAKRRTIGFARQTALTTENTTANDFTYFPCVFPDPDHAQEQEDFSDLQSGQAGAFEPPAPGSKSGGSITVQFPMSALKTGYDPTSEDPGDSGVISPAAVLLANAIGSAGNSAVSSAAEFAQGYHLARTGYVANDVAAGSTTTAINVNTGASYTTGSAVMVDSSASAGSPAFGWITDITSGTPDVITIAAASAVTAAASDNSYGVATGYMSGNDTVPLTFRVSGDNSAFLDTYIGCVAKSIKLDLAAKKTAMCEIVFQFADRKRYSTGGGIQDIASFQRVRPTLGNTGGRFLYDGSVTCGFMEMELNIEYEIADVECPSASEGVSEFVRSISSVELAAKVPLDSSDSVTANMGPFEQKYNTQSNAELQLDVVSMPGSSFSVFLPAAHVAEAPQRTQVNGMIATEVKFRPSRYTSDTGSTAPADSVLRFCVC